MVSKRFCLASLPLAAALVWSAPVHGADVKDLKVTPLDAGDTYALPKTPRGDVSVIVKFDVEPLATYRGGVPGLAPTSPEAVGGRRLDLTSDRAKAYEGFLARKEKAFEQAVAREIPSARLVHRFRKVIGGVSMILPAARVKDLARMPGVKAVYPDALLPLATDRSPEFIGAPELWSQVGGQGKAGEGVIVGIIDTGIWPEHPSLADDGSYPSPPPKWTGTTCLFGSAKPGDAAFTCNNKLIGASRHMLTFDTFGGGAGTPLPGEYFTARDNNGHGSHTSTTAAGNGGVGAGFDGDTSLATVSGIAPRAHVAAYKVCFTVPDSRGFCYSSDSAAAVQQAIVDGADVLNFSIGGGTNPYSDPVSLAFLDAYAAGVFVAASAGNSGPGLNTVGHREPWVTTVAATTTDRVFQGSALLGADGGAALTVTGASVGGPISPAAPVVLSKDFDDGVATPGFPDPLDSELCLNPFPPGTFTGMIVICKRGTNARVAKSANVAAGGAIGMILYNPTPSTLNADVHSIPTVHTDEVQGAALLAFMAANTGEQGTLTGGVGSLSGLGDMMAAFSSRGGPGQTLGVGKPDVGAPGVDILAGQSPFLAVPFGAPQLFQIISGTSMSSPHVAGAAAVLRQLHPDWTPGQIQSALMMTATTTSTVKEDGLTPTTPFDIGSGRIDLNVAGQPGLTISDTADNYILLKDSLQTANYPSLYIPVMAGRAVVQRTLKNEDHKTRVWHVAIDTPTDLKILAPHVVVLPKRCKKTLTLWIDASAVPLGETRHATLRFSNKGRELKFPITIVRKQGAVPITKSCDPPLIAKGGLTTCTIDVTNTTFESQKVTVTDLVPGELRLLSAAGAWRLGNLAFFHGTLYAALPPQVSVGAGPAPFGYFPLSLLGVTPIAGTGDETITNFTVSTPFVYAGTAYTAFGVVSNGYVVVGGGGGADIQFLNQSLPNPAAPNNVLAPFWTDLDASAARGGAMRVAVITDGVGFWLVCDWENVPNFSNDAQKNSFQVWIGLNGVQDITFAYGSAITAGDAGLLTVGAENLLGNSGGNFYYNGTGTPPTSTTEVAVAGAPGAPGETHTITLTAQGRKKGTWRNCADMLTKAVFGIATSCFDGEVQ